MARTKASTHRDATGDYMSTSESELGLEDGAQEYQLALTQAEAAVPPPSSAASVPHSEHDDMTIGEDSLGHDQIIQEHDPAIELPADTEREADDEEDEEDSEEENSDEDEEESQRARSRSVSSVASYPAGSRPNSIPPELMQVDEPAPDIQDGIQITQESTAGVQIPVTTLPITSGSISPRGRKGFDGPLSPLSSAVPSSPPKPAPPSKSPTPAQPSSSSKLPDPVPKKPKVKRPKSPDLPPPPVRPPMQTIRLELALGGPENYQFDVSDAARKAGMLPPLPELPTVITAAESEDSEEEEAKKKDAAASASGEPKKRKRRKKLVDTYDTHDPFIDDSLLDQDERKYIAQTKQTGFYVSSGEVALLQEMNPGKKGVSTNTDDINAKQSTKPRRSMPMTASGLLAAPLPFSRDGSPVAGPSGVGTRDSPIDLSAVPLADDDDVEYDPTTGIGKKRKRYITIGGPGSEQGGKKRKVVDEKSFHPVLQEALNKLKGAIAKQDWTSKGKFPPALKPLLAEVSLQAIQLAEYDDHFFNLMPVLFPYNKFTMTKLIKRTIYDQHIGLLNDRQDSLLKELKRQADEGFPKAEEEHERAIMLWGKRQEKVNSTPNGEAPEANGTDGPGLVPPAIAGEDGDDPMDGTGAGGDDAPPTSTQAALKRDQNPPQKKYRLTEGMRHIIWELVLLSNEAVRLENEKNQLENSVMTVSEQAARKTLYQKIVSTFPDGWMSSGQISRDVSAIKKKLEKEVADRPSASAV